MQQVHYKIYYHANRYAFRLLLAGRSDAESLQKIANFLPQRWTLDTLTKLQDGNDLVVLLINFMILFAFALLFS